MRKPKFQKRPKLDSKQGSTLIELLLIFPVVLIIIITAIEFTKILKAHQEISTISRAVAKDALRECRTEDDLQACLQPLATQYASFGGLVLENVQVMLSVYETDAGGNFGRSALVLHTEESEMPINDSYTRFSSTQLLDDNGLLGIEEPRVIVAEIFVRLDLSPLFQLFSPDSSTWQAYEATII